MTLVVTSAKEVMFSSALVVS